MSESTAYIPGVCNINPKETSQRRKVGHIGLVIFGVVLIALLLIGVTRYLRIILFLPAFVSAIGYLQAKNHFCVGYGGSGLQNAEIGSDEATKVTDNDAVLADKKRSRKMNLQAAGIAALLTIIIVTLPN